MVDCDQDLRHELEVSGSTISPPAERGSDRFYVFLGAIVGVPAFVVGCGIAGSSIGRGLTEIVVQGSNEWAVRGGQIGLGVGLVLGIVISIWGVARAFRSNSLLGS